MNAIVKSFEQSLALPFFGIGMKADLLLYIVICYIYIYIPLYVTYISNKNLLYSKKELYSISCINL